MRQDVTQLRAKARLRLDEAARVASTGAYWTLELVRAADELMAPEGPSATVITDSRELSRRLFRALLARLEGRPRGSRIEAAPLV